jgi:hypothetical protein
VLRPAAFPDKTWKLGGGLVWFDIQRNIYNVNKIFDDGWSAPGGR